MTLAVTSSAMPMTQVEDMVETRVARWMSPNRKCRRPSTPRPTCCRLIYPTRRFSKVNPADPPIMTLAVTSSAMPMTQVEDMVETRVAQKISQVSGVGSVTGRRPTSCGAR